MREVNLTSGPFQMWPCCRFLGSLNKLRRLVIRLDFRLWRHVGQFGQIWREHLVLFSWTREVMDSLEYELFLHPLPSIQSGFFFFFKSFQFSTVFYQLERKIWSQAVTRRAGSELSWLQGGKIPPRNFKWTDLGCFPRNFLELWFVVVVIVLSKLFCLIWNIKNSLQN